MNKRAFERGSALITVLALSSILLMMAMGLLFFSGHVHQRSIRVARAMTEQACTATGLQLARGYFGKNYANWDIYLGDPSSYNPLGWSDDSGKSVPRGNLDAVKALRRDHRELFADLDGDGLPDVYIYCRDNQDERPPATNDWTKDSDQVIVVGALCISETLVPLRQDDTRDPDRMSAEALLKWEDRPGVGSGPGVTSVTGGAGPTGSGNQNN